MTERYDKRRLKGKTERYWNNLRRNRGRRIVVWRMYAEEILPLEMACMQAEGRLPTEPCQTLILLVGQSIEPLLQSVWAHRPEELLLVLNQWYDEETTGENFASTLRGLLSLLPSERCVPDQYIHQEVVEPRPASVFGALVEWVRDREGVVIDITGAKKSMVAGAFLYAAYGDVPVSYVDFDDTSYSVEYSRPYGYASHIRSLENPYTAFALRDWERVRRLYVRYKFRDARLLLSGEDDDDGISAVLASMTKYLPSSTSAVEKLVRVLCCYELWDEGDHNQAVEIASSIENFEPPTVVSMLGGRWFQVSGTEFVGGLPTFYEDTLGFRAYVYDEMDRIERLINFNNDYRSAFLQASGLNEIVMVARMVELVDDDPEKEGLLCALHERTPKAIEIFSELIKPAGHIFRIGKDVWINKGAPEITVKITEEMEHWWEQPCVNPFDREDGWRELIYRRNDVTHKYFSVPRDWAQGALGFVRANVEYLWGPCSDGFRTEAMKWSELCNLTGLGEVLPPSLCK
ncbi:MAG: CRISPR-associated protein [Chloroflexota bacterium]|nr:CRISPR-associated protein [Chloroflexota bacterium]